ncbi:MAG: RNA polymerase factor sigma-54 [Candidatus Omnitrophica bacterium]|nr:RNA polymerase factor sigma-54 [Candidatus Omnitrophota bacterium]
MKLRQSQKLTQALSLTPHMKQSLHVLQLPLMELKEYIEAESSENPLLEVEKIYESEPDTIKQMENVFKRQKDWTEYPLGSSLNDIQKKRDYMESLITNKITLEDHLLKQLRMLVLSERKYKIAESIVTNLDDNGYLSSSIDEIVNVLNKTIFNEQRLTKKEAEKVLYMVHNFEPVGIGARNLKECLLIQLRFRKLEKSLAYKIVKNYLSCLAKNNLKQIAKKIEVDITDIYNAKKLISTLEPKPGREYDSSNTQELGSPLPDVILEKIEGRYEVIVNTNILPKLKISSYYLNLFKSGKVCDETKKFIQDKAKATLGLIKAISQREDTIRKIAQCLVAIQKDFFDHNDRSLLKPLTLKDVAKIVDRNESTVCRVVNKKYMLTPCGMFKFNYFFTTALKSLEGEKISQEYVKHQIIDIIESENKEKPFRDTEISDNLKAKGIILARRTVAKYREDLKISPHNIRKIMIDRKSLKKLITNDPKFKAAQLQKI